MSKEKPMNRFQELAGTGERAYTKALRLLLANPETQHVALGSLSKLTPGGLMLSAPIVVRREEALASGATPDIIIESETAFVAVENKINAKLTHHQRTSYLKEIEKDSRQHKALLFVVPDERVARYESEVAGLVGCATLRQAQVHLRTRGVVLHIVTWSEVAAELLQSVASLGPVAQADIKDFADFVRSGPTGGDLDDERVSVTPEQAELLAASSLSSLFSICDEVTHVLRGVFREFAKEWPLKVASRRRERSFFWVEVTGRRRHLATEFRVGVDDWGFWSEFGLSPIWITWTQEYDFNEVEAQALIATLKKEGLDPRHMNARDFLEDDETDAGEEMDFFAFGVPIIIPPTEDISFEVGTFKDTVHRILRTVVKR
jgi:hypothetical protein